MEYSNPKIPEGINTTDEHPLKEFFILVVGILGLVVVVVVILSLAAEKLAVYVPFKVEQELIPEVFTTVDTTNETRNYLQSLSDQLAVHMDLPEDMQITVHYQEGEMVNAFATIGGHIFIHQGLLEQLESENALAMVVAHEMAHVYHRHPIIAMGRGVVIGLLLTAVSGVSSDYFVGQVVGETGLVALLTFSRKQESESDVTALHALNGLYHHVNGSNDLFKVLMESHADEEDPPEFLSTHPLTQDRIDELNAYAERQGWDTDADLKPLPEFTKSTPAECDADPEEIAPEL